MHLHFFMFILAQALQQIRPEDLFCYYAICAMALRSKFEIVRVDHSWYGDAAFVELKYLPDAKWWQPFSKDGGDMAFKDSSVLFTSAFNPNGSGTMYAYKYNFSHSINTMTTSYRCNSQKSRCTSTAAVCTRFSYAERFRCVCSF